MDYIYTEEDIIKIIELNFKSIYLKYEKKIVKYYVARHEEFLKSHTDEEIHEFCTLNYNTQFPQMKKADVNGENELPLYTWLKSQKGFEGFQEHEYKTLLEEMFAKADPDWANKPDIKWNFTKFVIDRKGNVVARFEPTADIAEVEECIKTLL